MPEKDENWVVTVKDELERIITSSDTIQSAEERQWNKPSIYRVPACFTDVNMKAYMPQTVSFGPYRHGERHLAPMEKHKRRAFLHVLKRSNKPLESYLHSLVGVAQSLKDAYDSLDPVWERDTDGFLRLMILDGCFMLELLRNFEKTEDDYAYNDPIFSNHGMLYIVPYIRRDMLMLENQLPMLLLTTLLAVENEETKKDDEYLNKLFLKFFFRQTYPMGKCLHLLHMHRKSLLWVQRTEKTKSSCCRPSSSSKGGTEATGGGEEILRSAVKMDDAGINFKKSESESLLDISFKCGNLRLPPIVVDDTTESMFLNLLAFERFHAGAGNEITSYVFFMGNLIDTAKDISLLHAEGIIKNAIGSDKAAVKLFNDLGKDITPDPYSSLGEVSKIVNKYCKKPCKKWRANLCHTYCSNPWTMISVIAAIFLFALTTVQTYYTVYSSYH